MVPSSSAGDYLYVTTNAYKILMLNTSSSPVTATAFCGTGVKAFADGHCTTATFGTLGDVVTVGSALVVADVSNSALRQISLTTCTSPLYFQNVVV